MVEQDLKDLNITECCLGHDRLFCVAIDFGTTFSGYAYSTRDEYIRDPMKINSNQKWIAGTGNLVSLKTASCILLDPDKKLKAFGFEAEDQYSDLLDLCEEGDDSYKIHYFFRRFKMKLYNEDDDPKKRLDKNTTVEDENGRELPAELIFSLSIGYMKDHLMRNIQTKAVGVTIDDIHWVITVPAIWEDTAKTFMRGAAAKAGIPSENLTMALEPEAASIFCQLLPTETKTVDSRRSLRLSDADTTYMVLDLGGGTTDITVHQKTMDGTLKEIHAASGGPWGGTSVDKAYIEFLGDLIGKKAMKTFIKEKFGEFVEMQRDFEVKKRTITPESKDTFMLKVPAGFGETFVDCSNCSSIKEAMAQSMYSKDVSWVKDKIRVKTDIMKNLFKPTIDKIIAHVEKLLSKVKKVDIILMVGGFSESLLVQEAIKAKFSKYKIINPDDAGLAVLRGAVLFGHMPKAISSRIAKYTYGYEAWLPFKPGEHPEEKRIFYHGVESCMEVFQIYTKKGTEIKSEEVITSLHKPVSDEQTSMAIHLYVSQDEDPKFVTDPNVRKLGTLTFPLPPPKPGSSREIRGKLHFGDTELLFEAEDLETGEIHRVELECL